jgi:hypothetical protein
MLADARNAVAAPHRRPKVWTTDIVAVGGKGALENTRDGEPLGGPPTWVPLPSWTNLKVFLVSGSEERLVEMSERRTVCCSFLF